MPERDEIDPTPTDDTLRGQHPSDLGFGDDGNGLSDTDPQAGVVDRPEVGRIEDYIPSGQTPEEFGKLDERRAGYGLPGDHADRPVEPASDSGQGTPRRPESSRREHPIMDAGYRDDVMHSADHIDPDVLGRVRDDRADRDDRAEAERREGLDRGV